MVPYRHVVLRIILSEEVGHSIACVMASETKIRSPGNPPSPSPRLDVRQFRG